MDPIDRVTEGLQTGFQESGEKIVELVQQHLSSPVTISKTKSGKTKVTGRSKPGEHPKRDKGLLRSSVSHHVQVEGDVVRLVVSSDAPYAAKLQEEMDRVIFTDIPDLALDELINTLFTHIQQE